MDDIVTIREWNTERDLENYYRISFDLAKRYRYSDQQLVTLPEDELFRLHREDLLGVDFGAEKCMLFIAEDGGDFAEALWVAERERLDPWERADDAPAWVYDVEVEPARRGRGVGWALMKRAEGWAVDKGYARIGLHTASWLPSPLRLYRSLGYEDTAFILTATSDALPAAAAGRLVAPDGFEIAAWSPASSADDLGPMWELRLATFLSLLDRPPSSDDELRALHPRFEAAPDLSTGECVVLLARRGADGAFAGGTVGKTMGGDHWVARGRSVLPPPGGWTSPPGGVAPAQP